MNPQTESDVEPVLIEERRGGNVILTLNRPRALNAMNAALSGALGAALERAAHDPGVRVVIVTGAGDRAFCAGVDLKAAARGESTHASQEEFDKWHFGGFVKHVISKPIIAAVNGFALGGGTEMALASDLVVAADSATFGLPEVTRGLMAGAGGAFRLPQHLPRKIAMELLFTGDALSAQRALELGLVNRVVPREQLIDAAVELGDRIALNSPLAVQATKRLAMGIDGDEIPTDAASWERSAREFAELRKTEDYREGPRAFAEKRRPEWKGR
ncbi:enoyl-CoA hydratase-related protein [Trujillonella endophytica]|uniref:enoyl-CoA hydratase-related protein n=1 Tax=Trujillonella endophytica TaxID=673521 RepID=UPI001FCDAD6B|nr:enoyl-CoA hydratase-related protein [Trujillella endophytica]